MSLEVRSVSRALLIAWMSRETPTLDAPAICLTLALKHDTVNAANEALTAATPATAPKKARGK